MYLISQQTSKPLKPKDWTFEVFFRSLKNLIFYQFSSPSISTNTVVSACFIVSRYSNSWMISMSSTLNNFRALVIYSSLKLTFSHISIKILTLSATCKLSMNMALKMLLIRKWHFAHINGANKRPMFI